MGAEFKAITTVYSYRHPETRKIIDKLVKKGFPHHAFLKATEPPGALDKYHEPIIEKILDFYQKDVPALKDFSFSCPTSGSEEGIREVMTGLQAEGVKEIYVLPGEYEGYLEVGKTRNIKTTAVDLIDNPAKVSPGYFFISNPSARDGNIIPNEIVAAVCNAGHKVFYDLAYLGSTAFYKYDLSHPNIFAAVVSFSKTYGLFYDRIGFAFGREAAPSLYGNKWFKSIFALMIADAVVANLKPGEIYQKYSSMQEEIISEINKNFNLGMKPSDAFLLGYISKEDAQRLNTDQLTMIAKFKRGEGYRFCLTPYFVERDPEAQMLLGKEGPNA